MKLTRIRIEQFRQFRQALEINDLDAGINLFTGPNEAGKSTIVAALRAAFFERHRSNSGDDFRPWGDSSASPSVELDFVVGAQSYRLSKSFLGKKRCELQAGSRHLDGADAEDHLAELLGFQHAGKGASKAEHWGIPGLLWVQQGSAQEVRDAVTHAADHLRSALNESLGEVASSGGDELMATVEAARNELLTPATGAARGQHAEANKREATPASELSTTDAEIAAYRQKVDTLTALRREHAVDDAGKPWVGFRTQEHGARDKLTAIQRVEEAHTAEKLRAKQVEEQVKLLRGQLDRFASEQEAAETRAASLVKAQQAQATRSALVDQWRAKHGEAGARHEQARDRLLEVELETAGAQGLEERSAELARDLAQARRRAAELRRRASALDHLLNLLRDKRRALTRKLQAPLQKHLNRYLQLLFAQATLEIDENLSPGPLTRVAANGGHATESGAFEALSFGAREQMGVISHLAYADRLQEAGRPTLIILDDVLVHSDDEHLALMKRVLFDAATRHQILLFTCHPGNWRDLGVSARSLQTLRAAG